jgi:AAA+ ATPase superfamily predicted ATPase
MKIIIIKIIIVGNMKFYNREDELKELKTLSMAAEKQSVMLVLTGVRRVGKTELITEFFRKESGMYFFVTKTKTSNQLLDEFAHILSKKLNLSHLISIKTWDDFFEVLFSQSKDKKITIAFDEFQRFASIEPSLPSILQKHFDLEKKRSKLFIIVSGSSFGLLKKLFIDEGSPLFQRPANILRLRSFNFKLISKILSDIGIKRFEEKIELYSFFGGIPKFYELMEIYNIKSSDKALDDLLFRHEAPLRKEVQDVISEEFGKQSSTYYSILTAIALGKTKANEIADFAGIKHTSLPAYMYDVSELLGAVKREIQVTEPNTSKKVKFVLSNSFLRFWFRFVFPRESDYRLGRFNEIKKDFEEQKASFIGLAFEDICKEFLIKSGIGSQYSKIGKWWGNYKNEKGEKRTAEIDIVALNNNTKNILFASCKWRNRKTRMSDLVDLKKYSKLVEWEKKGRSETFAFFSKSGYELNAKEFAKENNWSLFDLEDMKKIFQ